MKFQFLFFLHLIYNNILDRIFFSTTELLHVGAVDAIATIRGHTELADVATNRACFGGSLEKGEKSDEGKDGGKGMGGEEGRVVVAIGGRN